MIDSNSITYIKNVTRKGHENGNFAYLDIVGTEFVLHFPDRFYDRILEPSVNELIILYQKMGRERYLTHLVQPVDDEIRDYYVEENFQFGRQVRILAYTGAENAIPMSSLPNINLVNSFGYPIRIQNRVELDQLEHFQAQVLSAFRPFCAHGLADNSAIRDLLDNDELERDFQSPEGKLLFRLHRTRERDSRLTAEKKRQALQSSSFFCSICGFSFETVYGENYIECHHTIPISQGERVTRLEDLALVCSNCHRMLHRQINGCYKSVDELRSLVSGN